MQIGAGLSVGSCSVTSYLSPPTTGSCAELGIASVSFDVGSRVGVDPSEWTFEGICGPQWIAAVAAANATGFGRRGTHNDPGDDECNGDERFQGRSPGR